MQRVALEPALIYCADGNPKFARCAVEMGWLYGAKLPSTVYERLFFADQDWKQPKRKRYMEALARHKPKMATVLDWEHSALQRVSATCNVREPKTAHSLQSQR